MKQYDGSFTTHRNHPLGTYVLPLTVLARQKQKGGKQTEKDNHRVLNANTISMTIKCRQQENNTGEIRLDGGGQKCSLRVGRKKICLSFTQH